MWPRRDTLWGWAQVATITLVTFSSLSGCGRHRGQPDAYTTPSTAHPYGGGPPPSPYEQQPYGQQPYGQQPYGQQPPGPYEAGPPASPPSAPDRRSQPPADIYTSIDDGACLSELARRGVPHVVVAEPGVNTPIRLTGPVRGIEFVMWGKQAVGSAGRMDTLDCRLALSLDDWAPILRRYGVMRVHHASLLRPGATIARTGRPSQHALGLAIDVRQLDLTDGRKLSIERDFEAKHGETVCPGTTTVDAARLLRALICETFRYRIFHLILTPNHDAAHRDHLHLDLESRTGWFDIS